MIIKICEKCHKPITCPLDACVCHAIKAERERICGEIKFSNDFSYAEIDGKVYDIKDPNHIKKLN